MFDTILKNITTFLLCSHKEFCPLACFLFEIVLCIMFSNQFCFKNLTKNNTNSIIEFHKIENITQESPSFHFITHTLEPYFEFFGPCPGGPNIALPPLLEHVQIQASKRVSESKHGGC